MEWIDRGFPLLLPASEWSVNRITDPQPTIFDVTATDCFKSSRQLQQTATTATDYWVKMVHFYSKISDNRPNKQLFG